MARLTTHVLDTVSGRPAAGVRIVLRREDDGAIVADVRSNAEGRIDTPMLEGSAFAPGRYELTYHIGDYFRGRGESLADPLFLDIIPVRLVLTEATNYHVPLLVSHYGFSVYRGS